MITDATKKNPAPVRKPPSWDLSPYELAVYEWNPRFAGELISQPLWAWLQASVGPQSLGPDGGKYPTRSIELGCSMASLAARKAGTEHTIVSAIAEGRDGVIPQDWANWTPEFGDLYHLVIVDGLRALEVSDAVDRIARLVAPMGRVLFRRTSLECKDKLIEPLRQQMGAAISHNPNPAGQWDVVISPAVPLGEGPGTELQKDLKRMGVPGCQSCYAMALRMNHIGPAACRERIDELVGDMYPRALDWWKRGTAWMKSTAWFRDDRSVWQKVKDSVKVVTADVESVLREGTRQKILAACDRAEGKIDPLPEVSRKAPPFPVGVTIGVTTFQRAARLRKCLESIAEFAPNAPVIVADNGSEPVDPVECGLNPRNIEYVTLPFDQGLSSSRNAIVARLKTPYLFLMEDDGELCAESNVAKLVDVLSASAEIGVVGCALRRPKDSATASHGPPVELDGIEVVKRTDLPVHTTPGGTSYTLCDMVYNFALFRTAFLRDHLWNDHLKVGEHVEYFLRVKHAPDHKRWLVAHSKACVVIHDSSSAPDSEEYTKARQRAGALTKSAKAPWKDTARPAGLAPAMSRCVIVTGTGFSGTSAVSEVLDRLGVQMGVRWVPAVESTHQRGYWEDAEFHAALKASDWARLQRTINHRVATQPHWGVKNPRVLDHLDDLLKLKWPDDTRIILCERNKESALATRRKTLPQSKVQVAEEVYDRRLSAQEKLTGGKWPVLRLDFDAVIADPAGAVRQIAKFVGVEFRDDAVAAIDPSLRHG